MLAVNDVGYLVAGELCISINVIACKLGMDEDTLLLAYKKFGDINFAVDYVKRNKKKLDARVEVKRDSKEPKSKKRGHWIEGVNYSSIKKIEEAYDIPSQRLHAAYLKIQNIEMAFNYVQKHDYEEHTRKIREQDNVRVKLIMKAKDEKLTMDTAYYASSAYDSVY